MKKIEALELAPQRSKLIIEYIEQILSDSKCVNGKFIFSSMKIENEMMLILDIYVPESNFEKHLNLGITGEHSLVLFEQFLNDSLDQFLEHETMGVSRYYTIKSSMNQNFSGINASNANGSTIRINFNMDSLEFDEIISKYNQKITDYVLAIQSDATIDEMPKSR